MNALRARAAMVGASDHACTPVLSWLNFARLTIPPTPSGSCCNCSMHISSKMTLERSVSAHEAVTSVLPRTPPSANLQHIVGVRSMQVPVPGPTVSPCKSLDPQCVDCANNVCTACNIIFTLDDATKKCGEPLLSLRL